MSEERKLTRAEKREVNRIKHLERQIIRRARQVVERGGVDATAIDDEGNEVERGVTEGWSARRRRVALDMRKSKRNAPVYIDVLTRIVENHDKAEAAKQQAAPIQLNIGSINVVKAPEYPVIDVTATAKGE